MKSVLRRPLVPLGAILAFGVATGMSPARASGFDVYLSAPASTATIYTNTITETFEEFTPGTYTTPLVGPTGFGTYELSSTNKLAIVADNQYGAGTGNYAALGAESGSSAPVTLKLASPQSYFGFSWNAGDANNTLSFYNGSTLVAYYSTATVTSLLKNTTVTALNGQTYQSSSYYGQPVSHQDSNEPFAFINFFDNSGTFDSIVFGNSNSTGTGFESDNHTIRAAAPAPDTSFVYVGSAVPEPSSVALFCGLGVAGGVAVRRRKRRR